MNAVCVSCTGHRVSNLIIKVVKSLLLHQNKLWQNSPPIKTNDDKNSAWFCWCKVTFMGGSIEEYHEYSCRRVKTLGVLSSYDQHSSNIHQTFPSSMDESKFPSEMREGRKLLKSRRPRYHRTMLTKNSHGIPSCLGHKF